MYSRARTAVMGSIVRRRDRPIEHVADGWPAVVEAGASRRISKWMIDARRTTNGPKVSP
jgi:hypothetical protein